MAKQGVDGIYDSDPKKNPDAKRFDVIDPREFLVLGLKAIDAAAVSLCGDNKLPLLAFELATEGNIGRAVAGEKIGTLVCRVDEVDAQ